ncbi:hypothetical protein EEB14_25685 [Rhodococcus sp. WS4]|nr:hypothetical protein EEB14_25685 [Rhodococcus sp. WS4]
MQAEDGLFQRSLGQVLRPQQRAPLPIPLQNPETLPLTELEPEVFERLVTEFVAHRSRSVHFYGRRGQAQYGLDIVEWDGQERPILHQVKRYQTLSPAEIRDAVVTYAGAPNPTTQRKFNPREFILVTSAEFDSDTKNVDELKKLRAEYAGDLALDVWGTETVSRMLQSHPRTVHRIIGPEWAKAWCGFQAQPELQTTPQALAFVHHPARVLNVESMLETANDVEETDPGSSANLYSNAADVLEGAGFAAHAYEVRQRAAKALAAAGDNSAAFSILFEICLTKVRSGASTNPLSQLKNVADSITEKAKYTLLSELAEWNEQASHLSTSVPALRELETNRDPAHPELCCMILENALVDGLYDFTPPHSSFVDTSDGDPTPLLIELSDMAGRLTPSDPILRARIACGVADSSLRLNADPSEVDAAYRDIVLAATAGGFLEANGLTAARHAYALAVRGERTTAQMWWQRSILDSCEAGYYGDALSAFRSISDIVFDHGNFPNSIQNVVAAFPNRRKLLANSSYDPHLSALDLAHQQKLPDAFGDTRRYLREVRLSGSLSHERQAMSLLADVLVAAEQPGPALFAYVAAGEGKKAEELAHRLAPVDISKWIASTEPRRRAGVMRVIKAQADRYPDELIPLVTVLLLTDATQVWNRYKRFGAYPEREAVKALAQLGRRIPETAINDILQIAEPALDAELDGSDTIVELLIQSYFAVPVRRTEIAAAIARMMRPESTPPVLWGWIQGLPEGVRGELIPAVEIAAAAGDADAVATAAAWGLPTPNLQRAARQACAALLRRPVGIDRAFYDVGTEEGATVDLLLALLSLDESELVDIDPALLTAAEARPAGGMIFRASFERSEVSEIPVAAEEGDAAVPDRPDVSATLAGGPTADLVKVVAEKLLAIGEDSKDSGTTRRNAIAALGRLLPYVEPDIAELFAHRLEAVHHNPVHSVADQVVMGMNHGLSRMRMGTGEGHLASTALKIAAQAHQVARGAESSAVPADRSFGERLTAAALRLLATDDRVERRAAANTLISVARAGELTLDAVAGLLGDRDPSIRANAIHACRVSPEMSKILATDPSPIVRAALPALGDALPDEVRELLLQDDDPRVRHAAAATQATGDDRDQ